MEKKRILLVDDDQILLDIMRARIEEEGYQCDIAMDGIEGLRKIGEKPDLVLLDIVMPNMNGYEVLEKVHGDPELSKVPIMVISNSGQPVEIEKILDLGVKDYIVKAHFSPEEVMEKVHKILGDATPAASIGPVKKPEETKVLIIEDDVMLMGIATDRFRHDGYQVIPASDGSEGYAAAVREMPDIILLDIIMPGMNGFDVLKQLKENESVKHIPVIIFTNLAQSSDIAKGKELGATDFLIKANFTPAQVVERVKKYLGSAAA